jgi:hypothetical protein
LKKGREREKGERRKEEERNIKTGDNRIIWIKRERIGYYAGLRNTFIGSIR